MDSYAKSCIWVLQLTLISGRPPIKSGDKITLNPQTPVYPQRPYRTFLQLIAWYSYYTLNSDNSNKAAYRLVIHVFYGARKDERSASTP